jgi:hypothetical protein
MADGRGWWSAPKWFERIIGHGQRYVDRQLRNLPPSEALKRAEHYLVIAIRTHGPDGMPAATARARVAWQLENMGEYAEASMLREEVLASVRRHLGNDHRFTLNAEECLAINLKACSLPGEARPLCEHIIEIRRRTLGPTSDEVLRVELLLASLNKSGDHD